MKTYYYCELDANGQRTGNYFPVALPETLIINRQGCKYSALSVVHSSGYVAECGQTLLFTSEIQAQRAALSKNGHFAAADS